MSLRYDRPIRIEEAQVFVGAYVKVHWNAAQSEDGTSYPAGWYTAVVSKVHRISAEGLNKLFFHIE